MSASPLTENEKIAEDIIFFPPKSPSHFALWQGMIVSGKVDPDDCWKYFQKEVAPILISLISKALDQKDAEIAAMKVELKYETNRLENLIVADCCKIKALETELRELKNGQA